MSLRFDSTLVADTVADLQGAGEFKDGQLCFLRGSASTGDGKNSMYYWDEDSVLTDASSTNLSVIQVTGQTKGRWRLLGGGNVEDVTAATLAVSGLSRAGKTYSLNRAAGIAVTLPAATGSGDKAEFIIGTTITSNTTTIKVNATPGTDTMTGNAVVLEDAAGTVTAFEAGATADTITFNGTTLGGLKGDRVELRDIASGLWQVLVVSAATGTEATPFSATV